MLSVGLLKLATLLRAVTALCGPTGERGLGEKGLPLLPVPLPAILLAREAKEPTELARLPLPIFKRPSLPSGVELFCGPPGPP